MQHLYVGLMSGTSMDGVDAAIVDFSKIVPTVIDFRTYPYPAILLQKIQKLCAPDENEIVSMGHLDRAVAKAFAFACNSILEANGIDKDRIMAVGSHGQTIRHHPEGKNGFSLQIGDPNTLAIHTGLPVIADFRRKDIALGGQGAPLAPAFHQAIFGDHHESRVVLNIGGISNLTYLPSDSSKPVIGYDTGPGNTLLDAWCQKHTGDAYDKNGGWAAQGSHCPDLLTQLLDHRYFKLPYPKSTGRETFHLPWLEQELEKLGRPLSAQTVQATLAEFTCISIAKEINRFEDVGQVYVCGGGAHNDFMMECLENELFDCDLHNTSELGIHPDAVEAVAFAWLAYQYNNKLPGNLPSVTGASRQAILGACYLAD